MALATNIPVEDIETLAGRIQTESGNLENQLNALRSAVARDASFTGAAANAYDEFLSKWDASQRTLLESIRGAGNILSNLASTTRQNDQIAATSFD